MDEKNIGKNIYLTDIKALKCLVGRTILEFWVQSKSGISIKVA